MEDVLSVAGRHAAVILRPRAVQPCIDNDVSDMASAQILRLGRKAEKGIDLALREQIERFDRRIGGDDPANVLGRIEPDMRGHDGHEGRMGRPQTFDADTLSLQFGYGADALAAEQFEAADMDAGEHDDRYAGIDR